MPDYVENYQEIIESGRLEQYALGELDPAAQAEVEAQARRFPEVRQELDELLAGVGAYAQAYAATPPAGMRERVLGRVLAEISASAAPAAATPAAPVAEVPTMRVSTSNPQLATPATPVAAPVATRSGWAIAASVALLLSLVGNALLYSSLQKTRGDLATALSDQTRFANATQVLERRLSSTQDQLHVLRSPSEYKMVALAGTPAHPQARARVLYSKATRRVYLDVQQLPTLPAGKQYQLWALNNGKPVDAGMLTPATTAGDDMQQMKDVASAQAFAMTVEPVGGSVNPTLNTMTVIGNI